MRISEVFANPNGEDDGKEYVELWNPGSEPVNVTGLVINHEDQRSFTFMEGEIPAGQTLVFDPFRLRNDGATLSLVCDEVEVDRASYPKAKSGVAVERDQTGAFCPVTAAFGDGFGNPGTPPERCMGPP